MLGFKLLVYIVIPLAVIIGGYILLNQLNKIRAKKPYADYYARKRREFPWLDKWIKENVNPAELRASEGAGTKTATSFALFIVFGGIGGIIAFIYGSWVVFFVFVAIGLLISELIGRKHLKNPATLDNEEVGLTLECPSCHCPHSWVLLEEENIVEESETVTTKTTRSGYGQGDLMDSLLEGFKENGTTVKSITYYYGRSERDFKCLNCNHTEHREYKAQWTKYEPEEHIVHNPPKAAWMPQEVAREIMGNRANNLYEQVKAVQTNTTANAAPDTEATAASIPNLAGIDDPEVLYTAAQKASENGDDDASFQFYRMAAELGHIDACFEAAQKASKNGDDAKSFQFYLIAAKLGNIEACFEAAQKASNNGDDAKSFQFYLMAAELGNIEACSYVASSYENGRGVEQDYVKYIMWCERKLEIEKSSAYGNVPSYECHRLGEIYRDGRYGIPIDLEKARYWFQIAADNDYGDAKKALKKLNKLK
jgi:hypothetical protein